MAEAIAQTAVIPDPYTMELRDIDVSRPEIMQQDAQWDYFARLREEAPVHYCENGMFGPFWSLTKFNDIMAMDKNHHDFSSDLGITLIDRQADFSTPNFISMDPPKHDVQRHTVQGVVAPMNLAKLESSLAAVQRRF